MRVKFWKFSTAGNTTLFTTEPGTAGRALSIICAEQAGFANLAASSLTMAGGEFCANACLAFAALLALNGFPARWMQIADREIGLEIEGCFPDWHCQASFSTSGCKDEAAQDGYLRHLPGITHKLMACAEFPDRPYALATAANLAKVVANPAAGAIWWRKNGEIYEIMPAVAVPAAGTCNLEQACGSGSLALAGILPEGRHRIRQPSGEILEAATNGNAVLLAGPVHFLASGEVWI